MLELALKRADQGQLERPAIEVAYSSANDLLELIGDILDIARIEAGHLSLNPERASLRQLSSTVVRMFEGLARQKHLTLQFTFDSRLDADVLIDPLRFKQILSNLISNAIKFTPAGEVRITLQAGKHSTREHLHLKLSVKDSGIGISASDQQRLFEPFAQADNSGQMPRSGAGLGLVICRNLCSMMGGHLQLDSQPGQGTCVTLELMLERLELLQALSPTPVMAPPAAQPRQPLNILVVDDHPANRMVLSQQLEFLGHRCQSAEHGKAGLQLWQETDFDLLMVDCNMPVMNGYELSHAIRDQERLEQRQPCIIWGFTANAQPEEIPRCREAGMDDCLFKPIGLTALSERLASLAPAAAHSDTGPTLFNPGSIEQLTAGRNDMTRRLLGQLLDSSREDRQTLSGLEPDHQRPELQAMAHRIKGAARIICATSLVEACESLEDACTPTNATCSVSDCQQRVISIMQALERQLQAQLRED